MNRILSSVLASVLLGAACSQPQQKSEAILAPELAQTHEWASGDRVDPLEIKEFVRDPLDPRGLASTHYREFKVTQDQLQVILTRWHVVDRDRWEHRYSHVGGLDRTGKLILKDATVIQWMVRPGGLATVQFPNDEMSYFAQSAANL